LLELVTKLAKGIYEYDDLKIKTSVDKIDLKIEAGVIFDGSFEIESKSGKDVKGLIQCDNPLFEILTDRFNDSKHTVKYKISTIDMVDNDTIDGEIKIISSGGEIVIPLHVQIEESVAKIGDVRINSPEEFAKFVSTDFETAFGYFISEDFKNHFLRGNSHAIAVYEGLMADVDKKAALEEFLIEMGLKDKILLDLDQHDDYFEDVFDDVLIKLNLKKTTWGYEKIDILCDDEFIKFNKTSVTTNDFVANACEVSYIIDSTKLHSGKNFGRIVFRTFNQTLEYNVTVYNAIRIFVSDANPKKTIYDLMQTYLRVRTGKIDKNEWIYHSLEYLNEVSDTDEDTVFLTIYKAQLLLSTEDRKKEASNLLEYVADYIIEQKWAYPVLYCYYLYVRSLEKQDDDYTKKALNKVKEFYEEFPDNWKIYWVLMHLEESDGEDYEDRYAKIKFHFYQGCKSPIMYYEALELINASPDLVRNITNFELQVLSFGVKWDCLDNDVIMQLSDLAKEEKNFSSQLCEILVIQYDKTGFNYILEALVSQLIAGNKTARIYHKYYEKAIEQEMKIVSLYENYIASIDENDYSILPKNVLMYFSYNTSSLYGKQSYLFANLVLNRDKIEEYYRKFLPLMEKYAVMQLIAGRIDEKLAIIYKAVITDEILEEQEIDNITDIANTYKIECHNPDVNEVLVYHKELAIPQIEKLKDGVAYLKIYTDNPVIIFRDVYGGMHGKSIKYSITRLFGAEKIIKKNIVEGTPDRYMLIAYINQYLKFSKDMMSVFDKVELLYASELLRSEYRKEFMENMVDYYYEFYDDDAVAMFITRFANYEMNKNSRSKLAELMIMQGMYDDALNYIEKYNIYNISPNRAFKLCVYLFDVVGEEKYNKVLLDMSLHALKCGKYNDKILGYLSRYYEGTVSELIEIYEASVKFDFESVELLENILVHSMFSNKDNEKVEEAFEKYFYEGFNRTIKQAYISKKCYEYLIKNIAISPNIIKFAAILLNEKIWTPDTIKLAYIDYHKDKELDDNCKKTIERLMRDLSLRGMSLNCFNSFIDKCEIPFFEKDGYVIEYRNEDDKHPYVTYTIREKNGEEKYYEKQSMKKILDGLYTLEITVFFGQTLDYKIVVLNAEDEKVRESKSVCFDGLERNDKETRYGLINSMIEAKSREDMADYNEIVDNYQLRKSAADMYFDIKNGV